MNLSTAKMKKRFTSPVYAFFSPDVEIGYYKERRMHIFRCAAKGCKHSINRLLDTGDRAATGRMWDHVKTCWGADIVSKVKEAKDKGANADRVREEIVKPYKKTGRLTDSFKATGKGKITYSHSQHTRTETR